MTPERRAQEVAHDTLRAAIRQASLTQWDRRIAKEDDPDERLMLAETRAEVEAGVLIEYVVVAVFDSGSDDHDVTATLRTDGQAAQYRTVGLLHQALQDIQ